MTTRIFLDQMKQAPAHLIVREREPGTGLTHSGPEGGDDRALLAQLTALLEAHGHVLVASDTHVEAGKVAGVSAGLVDRLARAPGVDAVILEADGSRRLPFKAPADHEPVIPGSTTIVVPMVGMDALGRPLDATAVHRPERVAALTGAAPRRPDHAGDHRPGLGPPARRRPRPASRRPAGPVLEQGRRRRDAGGGSCEVARLALAEARRGIRRDRRLASAGPGPRGLDPGGRGGPGCRRSQPLRCSEAGAALAGTLPCGPRGGSGPGVRRREPRGGYAGSRRGRSAGGPGRPPDRACAGPELGRRAEPKRAGRVGSSHAATPRLLPYSLLPIPYSLFPIPWPGPHSVPSSSSWPTSRVFRRRSSQP